MDKKNVVVIFTCFNRKNKTVNCMKTLVEKNYNCNIEFIVVDDNSSDGTSEAVKNLGYNINYIKGNGDLFWAGGMRKGIGYFLSEDKFEDCEYVVLVNDDVDFFDSSLDKMIACINSNTDIVMVGNCCNNDGKLSYGAAKYDNKIVKLELIHLGIERADEMADTFNCNCVLLPANIIRKLGNFDSCYTHSMADYDYGLLIKKSGYKIYGTDFYVGMCNDDNLVAQNVWSNNKLPMKKRLQLKESPKGLPFKEHYHYLMKNFGLLWTIRYLFTPYIRIIFKK